MVYGIWFAPTRAETCVDRLEAVERLAEKSQPPPDSSGPGLKTGVNMKTS